MVIRRIVYTLAPRSSIFHIIYSSSLRRAIIARGSQQVPKDFVAISHTTENELPIKTYLRSPSPKEPWRRCEGDGIEVLRDEIDELVGHGVP